VNWQHLQAILWLRWRITRNQLQRGGLADKLFLALIAIVLVGGGVGGFLLGLLLGAATLSAASADLVMLVWDGVVVVFLFFWTTGVMTELQRSEVLSLDKLLHLPVSPFGAFCMNYLGSLVSVCLVLFVPGMIGLCLALVMGRGAALLPLFPLLLAFLLMVTALTYQFQGWLAAMMTNKRRRRTILAVLTSVFLLFTQLPSLFNIASHAGSSRRESPSRGLRQTLNRLDRMRASGEITPAG